MGFTRIIYALHRTGMVGRTRTILARSRMMEDTPRMYRKILHGENWRRKIETV